MNKEIAGVSFSKELAFIEKIGDMFPEKNPAAVALGSIKSDKKAAASRKNGKKGGRPRKHGDNPSPTPPQEVSLTP